jgi:2-desacetyl-2-hydroxyethyl bacteriochlorophyllide A dehydrogenase
MKAIRIIQPHRPLEMREIEAPPVGAKELLVRTMAAGICHSDAHYRAGLVPAQSLPLTPGHEVAGVVAEVGAEVTDRAVGDRVCLHYLVTCGECAFCRSGHEQFCATAEMLGKDRDGGYGEFVCVPARNAFLLPDEVPFPAAAVLMCSSSTSLHALRKARLAPGETVAVFGAGGLGLSAVQLARALGAREVYAVDLDPDKLAMAEGFGALPVLAEKSDPVAEIRRRTGGRGVDVALELIGLPLTMSQALRSLAKMGRAAVAGITTESLAVDSYRELIAAEAELIGVSDHLATEIPELLEYLRSGSLDLSHVITETVPREPDAINGVLDRLDAFGSGVRAVIETA